MHALNAQGSTYIMMDGNYKFAVVDVVAPVGFLRSQTRLVGIQWLALK